MKKTISSLALLALAISAQAQVILTPTTLSAAVTSASIQTIVVASATPNASTLDNFAIGTGVIIDNEYMTVKSISSTTIGVIRGQSGTRSSTHASSALVWSARPNFLITKTTDPQGSCTRTNDLVEPVVNALTGNITDCLGGRRVTGAIAQWPPARVMAPDPGGTLYTGINTNGTAVGATTLYCSELRMPVNKLLTGLEVLNGTTVTANARYVILYDSQGNALANSALAGQASVTASVYEQYPFTTKFFAVGPAQYFACLQDNAVGSTTVRMAVTGQADQLLTKGQTSATFGTVPALTVPTTFTTAVGPFMAAYN